VEVKKNTKDCSGKEWYYTDMRKGLLYIIGL